MIQDDETGRATLVRRPLGIVAAITAWNYPLLLVGWKLGPSALAGNAMVLKPSPFTPLSTLRVGELLAETLPPGVFNVVSGGDPLGAAMTTHPAVDKVSFTGSVATGQQILGAVAPDLKRVTLELGGNDGAIVLDDVDLETLGAKLFWAGFINSGQMCAGIKRVYVARSRYDEVVEFLSAFASRVRVGAPDEPSVQLGPVQNERQFARVRDLVEDAVRRGGSITAGGKPLDRPGYFFAPTVLTDVQEGVRVVDEEQFGPVLPVMPFDSPDEAVDRANDTTFGLAGSVWGRDRDRAGRLAAQLQVGTAYVNSHLTIEPHLPFGGAKWSGLGVENGRWGLEEFTQLQVQYSAR